MYKLELRNRKSIRLKQYDYSSQGMYFITICVKNRECILSKINCKQGVGVDDHVDPIKLQTCGKIVQEKIKNINYAYENVMVNQYVIMPNHVHMIISIKSKGTLQCAPTFEKFGTSTSNSIPEIIRAIKGRVTRELNKKYNKDIKLWQRNYYEHVVRNEKELQVTMEYIEYNPFNWKTDPLNNVGAHCNVPKRYKIINKNTKK